MRYWPWSDPEPPPREDEATTDEVCGNESCGRRNEEGAWVRTPASRSFCDECEHRIANVLRELPEWYARLHLMLAESGAVPEKVSGTPSDPVPLNLGVDELIWDLEKILPSWEDDLRKHFKWPAKMDPAGPRGVRFQATCRWLRDELTPLLASPGGVDAGREILELGLRCRRALGETRLVHRLLAPCPSCDLVSLQRENGKSEVCCSNPKCLRRWSEEEYERLVLVLATEQRLAAKGKEAS